VGIGVYFSGDLPSYIFGIPFNLTAKGRVKFLAEIRGQMDSKAFDKFPYFWEIGCTGFSTKIEIGQRLFRHSDH
jgi:hypothetical protein